MEWPTATDLGALGGNYSIVYGINNAGQVVGESNVDVNNLGYPDAALWENGAAINLNSLPILNLGDWKLVMATGINDKGWIVGYATNALTGENHAFKLMPTTVTPRVVPTPASTTVPSAPTNLTAVTTSSNLIALNWTDTATNEKNYLIERCIGASCTNFSQIAQVGANVTTYSNTGLSRNTSYRYRISATNAYGKSAYSNTLNTKTLR